MEHLLSLSEVHWIGGYGNRLLRKSFSITKPVSRAKLFIVSDPHTYAKDSWMVTDGKAGGNWLLGGSFLKYRIFVNGQLQGAGPFRGIRTGNAVLHSFDLTGALKSGNNVLGVFLRGEKFGMACKLQLEYTDGSMDVIVSDSSWKMLGANEIYSPVCWHRQSLEQDFKSGAGPGEWNEHINGELYPDNWTTVGFDDSSWERAADHGTHSLPTELTGLGNYTPERVAPQEIRKFAENRYIVDFGREVFAGLEITGPAAGGEVEIRLSETLQNDGSVCFIMRTFNCYQEVWRFRPNQTLAHFGLRMFRYAEIVDYTGELTPDKITAVTLNTPFGETDADFACDNSLLNDIWKLCRNTIKYTNADIYTDSLVRERIAYEADSYINLLTSLAMERNFDLARRTILYQLEHPTWPIEWTQFAIPLVYEYYMASGDLNLVKSTYSTLAEKFSFHRLRDNTGLVKEFPGRIIIDWPDSQRDGYEFGDYCNVPNAFVYYDLVLLAELARYLGLDADRSQWKTLAAEQFAAFNRVLFDAHRHLYRDCAASEHSALHSAVFAAAFGLVPEHAGEMVGEFMAKKGMACSVYASQFLLEALFKLRRGDTAVDLMLSDGPHSWQGMLKSGATATFEAWTSKDKPNMTQSHPWGAAPGNMIARGIFGLRPTQPGWEDFSFDPQMGKLKHARIVLPTKRGFIHAEIRQDSRGNVEKDLEIRAGADLSFCRDIAK